MPKDKDIVYCNLCGEPIEPPKGVRRGELSKDEEQGAHIDKCLKKQYEIMANHGINPNAEVMALLRGLIEMHPEVQQSKPVFEYRNREDEMKEELYKTFPYLKKKEEELEKLRKKVEEKVEKDKEEVEGEK